MEGFLLVQAYSRVIPSSALVGHQFLVYIVFTTASVQYSYLRF